MILMAPAHSPAGHSALGGLLNEGWPPTMTIDVYRPIDAASRWLWIWLGLRRRWVLFSAAAITWVHIPKAFAAVQLAFLTVAMAYTLLEFHLERSRPRHGTNLATLRFRSNPLVALIVWLTPAAHVVGWILMRNAGVHLSPTEYIAGMATIVWWFALVSLIPDDPRKSLKWPSFAFRARHQTA